MWQANAWVGGKRKTKAVPVNIQDEAAAQTWFDNWYEQSQLEQRRLSNDQVVSTKRKTFRSLSSLWFDLLRARYAGDDPSYNGSKRTLEHYVLTQPIADVDIEGELDIGHCTAWVEWLKTLGKSPLTVRNVVQTLRGFLVDARGKGWVKLRENPLLDPYLKKVMPKRGPIVNVYLDEAQVRTLLTCDSPGTDAIKRVRNLTAIATGMRAGELIGLVWSNVDLDKGLVRVFQQVRPNGPGQFVVRAPKKDSHRTLPLHPTALAALKWWRDNGWKVHTGRDPEPTDPVFCGPNGGWLCGNFPFHLRRDMELAGLSPLFDGEHLFDYHALRKTFATLLEDSGVARNTRDVLMGHGAKGVGDRHYVGKNINRFREAINKMPLPKPEELSWLR